MPRRIKPPRLSNSAFLELLFLVDDGDWRFKLLPLFPRNWEHQLRPFNLVSEAYQGHLSKDEVAAIESWAKQQAIERDARMAASAAKAQA